MMVRFQFCFNFAFDSNLRCYKKGSAGALTAAGLLAMRGQEGATLDGGGGSALVTGRTGVSIEAGGGGGDANITSASGDISLSAPAGRLFIDSLQGVHFPKGRTEAGAYTSSLFSST